ncbi:MAG: glycoside hydrolase family 2 TIM barrel-domain containing protein [Candidatus Omnitrophica bacterium]|nr:glycoside hydrolase family 2 TIM barrel-domain containing protein [Candidatus Omnitrophota bacterium]MDD5081308.1 glycoside hydrolase family 2 TIM barrel-domain containing protein [Candidatus Omnitrophota bacterium]MDD5440788.1 glycoside hydrolase family 2 TIM barrel-domain containing protein [Candidatus Omnitrophota bacterium]
MNTLEIVMSVINFKKSFILFFFALFFLVQFSFSQGTSKEYVNKAWSLRGEGKFDEVHATVADCILQYGELANEESKKLTDFPPNAEINNYQAMNDVATCYFIKGEALRAQDDKPAAKEAFSVIVEKYPYAQAFDPRGWYWSIKEKAEMAIAQIEGKSYVPENIIEEEKLITLNDEGTEFPVKYEKYGEFKNVGTKDYVYVINDPIGLAKAIGEGLYPNTTSVKFDPAFIELKKKLSKIDHWSVVNSRDLKTSFYKWTQAPESPGIKLFYLADLLERSGYIEHAIKAYYAILVHFPKTYGWTYWRTPWYIATAAKYRIMYLLEHNPQLELKLEGCSVIIENEFDHDVRNDVFIVNPGKLAKLSMLESAKYKISGLTKSKRRFEEIVSTRGGDKVKLVKYSTGDWQMLVDGIPFIIKGITYDPTTVGESPDEGTHNDWTREDHNENGIIDAPYETWIDANGNNLKDSDEHIVGDFQLMKDMGVNMIRLYYQPFDRDKELLRKMYDDYGIAVGLGNFIGKYAIGSGATWEEGTDYDNPEHIANMLADVGKMVEEFKEEPYVYIWILGNENLYGFGCNADKKPESFFKFVDKAAKLIKELDPYHRPVAIASGDTLHLDIFARECPDVDIFGTNSYRGRHGFLNLWDNVSRMADKPAMITEYGAPSFGLGFSLQEGQDYQAKYHASCWNDIYYNSAGYGAGDAIGGFAFEFLDEWWKAYEPWFHDRNRLSAGPFLDGYFYEEWFGFMGQGDGKTSPYLRKPKEVYYIYKHLWGGEKD